MLPASHTLEKGLIAGILCAGSYVDGIVVKLHLVLG